MKLSKITYLDLLLKCKKNDIKNIVFCNFKTEKKYADYGVVFGGISMIPYRIEEAIKLYNERKIKKIILTGGIGYFNINRRKSEAYKMYDYLQKKGIPDNDIIIESSSKSTNENVKNVLKIISENEQLKTNKIILITSDFHLKRCIGLMSKYFDNPSNLFGVGVKDGKTDINHWDKSLYGKIVIIKEAFLLCYYVKNGNIADISL